MAFMESGSNNTARMNEQSQLSQTRAKPGNNHRQDITSALPDRTVSISKKCPNSGLLQELTQGERP